MSELFKRVSMGGKVAPGDLEVKAPFDGEVITMVKTARSEEIESALASADAVFHQRDRWIPKAKRIEILEKTAAFIAEQAEDLAYEIAQESGKPLVDARTEVRLAAGRVRLASQTLRTQAGAEIPMDVDSDSAGRVAFTRRDPIGPVVVVSAATDPLGGVVRQVAPAAAAGCPVILKPSSTTPLSGLRFVEMLQREGFGEDWCQSVVTPDHTMTERLVSDPRVAFVSFTGRAQNGWKLRSLLAPGTRCTLAHGGASAVIVAADAAVAGVAPLLAEGGFFQAGQLPVSVQRVFVEDPIARQLAEELVKVCGRLVVGDPTSDRTHVGPLLTNASVDRVQAWVDEAVAGGAEVLCGGVRYSASCYRPTVLWNPPSEAKVSREEIFGPVVCVYPVADLDEAIARANDVPAMLHAALFTRALTTVMDASARLNASSVIVNDHSAFRVDWLPSAGIGKAGLGVADVPNAIAAMQVERTVVVRSGR